MGLLRGGHDRLDDDDGFYTGDLRALDEGRLTLRELKWCVCNTIRLCIQSNQYEDAVSYLEQFQDAK